jgi:hypothetical protein
MSYIPNIVSRIKECIFLQGNLLLKWDVRWFQAQMVRDVVLDISVLISIQQTRKQYAEKLSTRNNGPFTHRHFDSNFFVVLLL